VKNFVGVGGIFNYSATDHLGLDHRSTFIAVVKNGEFRLYESK
jgi:branched-chain amino acid transport system substrate-binding protein